MGMATSAPGRPDPISAPASSVIVPPGNSTPGTTTISATTATQSTATATAVGIAFTMAENESAPTMELFTLEL